MSLVFGILEEERARLEELVAECDKALEALPKESVHMRKINGKSYLYSIIRKHGKVISRYVGECSNENAQKAMEQDSIRRACKLRKKEALASIKEIRRLLGKKIAK
jgi:hypothetical protein